MRPVGLLVICLALIVGLGYLIGYAFTLDEAQKTPDLLILHDTNGELFLIKPAKVDVIKAGHAGGSMVYHDPYIHSVIETPDQIIRMLDPDAYRPVTDTATTPGRDII